MIEQPGAPERNLQVGLALAAALLLYDLAHAVGATACSLAPVQDCYRWGSESSSGDDWHYATKATYLLSGIGAIAILVLAIAVPFFTTARGTGLAAMILVLLLGFLSLEPVVTAVLPGS